ncbi:tRNA isopentenyltransferase [Trichoderma citrinoviride]|uniref:tRNA dimethylallyltransferase n=1 Tax=Trichoderma citrinoviride TaxID=58853 RepID=A0A2T4BJG2_9HYPO|nr:tRNA isopentenyltransferase [Trichoderma citrinoviride]PTB69445.1 tRNA isopentenyltransferase [Trichoderma citrinoviride]
MAAHAPPAEPLLVVLGSTGTGKSELAVELARRFKGEIINSDAMQLYDGLPIITNKITQEERHGIPHHLLGHIPLDDAPWDVEDFKTEATKVIREIRSRGNLPILVGGTQYYVDPLLFKDVILDDVKADPSLSFPILEQPTDVLLEELKKVDPIMAERWHPNDRRKIQRSLEIYLHTGRPASELYAEQERRKAAAAQESGTSQPWEKLLFWVYSERETLTARLDSRVDKMLGAGLLDEVQELFDMKRRKAAEGQILDMTKGIWQSIGYKQFEPYMSAKEEGKDPAELEKLKASGLEDMKAATRRYANYQTRWIRLKQIPRLKEQGPGAVSSLYLVDSTDVSQFKANVVEPAAEITAKFLAGEPRPTPIELSDVAREVLTRVSEPPPRETPSKKTCEICQTVCVTEQAWQRHIKSAAHKRVMKRKKRLALVPVDKSSDEHSDAEASSEPDVTALFAT